MLQVLQQQQAFFARACWRSGRYLSGAHPAQLKQALGTFHDIGPRQLCCCAAGKCRLITEDDARACGIPGMLKSKPLTSLCASMSSRIRSPLNNCPLPSSHFEHPFYLLQAVTVALMAGSAGMYAISEGTKPSAKKNTPEGQL